MNSIKQYVTRRRRIGEEIENPDCFDEYIGKDFIRTVRFINGIPIDQDESIGNIKQENNPISVEINHPKPEPEPSSFKVTVNHACGINEFIHHELFDVVEYTQQLNNFYWPGFVNDIVIDGI